MQTRSALSALRVRDVLLIVRARLIRARCVAVETHQFTRISSRASVHTHQSTFLGRALSRAPPSPNISVAARIGGGTVFPGVVVARGRLLGALGVGVFVGAGIALPVVATGTATVLAAFTGPAAGVPKRRSRASSIDRPMFWMIERTCWALRVGRGVFCGWLSREIMCASPSEGCCNWDIALSLIGLERARVC